ncbi:hypothetical protein LCGC14_0909140 [marine sediment metagenome]|uniref:Uncharacterized protein n=1 Tax=marine sediment metagenome TaxID=412755 RepID=A0A0F9PEU0_9ZZZZ
MIKTGNKTVAAAAHKPDNGQSVTGSIGPLFFLTVPVDYEEEELKQVRDAMMELPAEAVGGVVVTREGVTITKI